MKIHMLTIVFGALLFSGHMHSMEKALPAQKDELQIQARKLYLINHLAIQIIVTFKDANQHLLSFVIDPHSTYEHTFKGVPEICHIKYPTMFTREKFGFAPVDATQDLKRLYKLHASAGIKLHVDMLLIPFLSHIMPALIWMKFAEDVGAKLIKPGMHELDAFPGKSSITIRHLLGLNSDAGHIAIWTSKEGFIEKWKPVLESENTNHVEIAKRVIETLERAWEAYREKINKES